MFQRSELGKYVPIKDRIKAAMYSICVTPDNDKYCLIDVQKIGRKRKYIYAWLNSPKVGTDKLESEKLLGVEPIFDWINKLKRNEKNE